MSDQKFDVNELMSKAKDMQEQMQTAQKEIAEIKVVGQAGGGLVKVTMNGAHYLEKTEVSPTVMSEDEEYLEDLVTAAVNDAVKKIEEGTKGKMMEIAKGFQMPEGFEDYMGGNQ